MQLKDLITLERPLIWLDVETANITQPEQARICELGFQVLYPASYGKADYSWNSLINPLIPIERETHEKHGISDEDVKDKATFVRIAEKLAKGFQNCDYAGYNVQFDLRVLSGEFSRAVVPWSYEHAAVIDPLRLWQVSMPRTLSDAVREFCKREPTNAHRASEDAKDAHDVLLGQLERWQDLPRDVKKLGELCYPKDPNKIDPEGKFRWKGNDVVITFGKNNGVSLRKLDRGYLEWICKGGFSEATKQIARDALVGKYPEKPA